MKIDCNSNVVEPLNSYDVFGSVDGKYIATDGAALSVVDSDGKLNTIYQKLPLFDYTEHFPVASYFHIVGGYLYLLDVQSDGVSVKKTITITVT